MWGFLLFVGVGMILFITNYGRRNEDMIKPFTKRWYIKMLVLVIALAILMNINYYFGIYEK